MKGMVDPNSISCTFHGGKKTIGSQVQKVGASLTLVVQISSFILRRENLRGCRLRGWGVSGSFKNRWPEKCPIKIQVWSFLEVSGYMFIGKESDGDSMVSCWDPGYARGIGLILYVFSIHRFSTNHLYFDQLPDVVTTNQPEIFQHSVLGECFGPITCGWVKESKTKQKGG